MQRGTAVLRTREILSGTRLEHDCVHMDTLMHLCQILYINILLFCINQNQKNRGVKRSMANSWSFPTSPRNPGKVRLELEILSQFVDVWKEQGKKWAPNTTQMEFGEALRASGVIEGESDTKQSLSFQRQADTITMENLAWTARARFGTFKFLGFTHITNEGYADLTEAGRRIINTKRPDIIMLKQLIKWQYPDNQHKGKTYSEGTFHIWPFMAV